MRASRQKMCNGTLGRALGIGLVWLLTLAAPAAQAESVERLEVIHQPAEVLAERVRALFPESDVRLVGVQNQIVIRARNAEILSQVRDLVAQLDQRPRQFRISLRRQQNQAEWRQNSRVEGAIGADTSIRISTSRNSLGGAGESLQVVTVLENQAVALRQGQLKPIRNAWLDHHGNLRLSTGYQQLGDVLLLTPRLLGNGEVELSVHASHARENNLDDDRLDQLALTTQTRVSPGSWFQLGSTGQRETRSDGRRVYSAGDLERNGSFEIKVELLD